MFFLHTYLLAGMAGIAIPVIIHLFNRRSAREVHWGAMQFLLESMRARRRSLLLEEVLLLATRALVVGCAVLMVARPFVPAGSVVPWWLVLPLIMVGVVFFGASFALGQYRGWQWGVRVAALLALLGCVGLIGLERRLNLGRFGGGEARDIALVIDGSSSMTLEVDGESNFSRTLKEIESIVEESPRGVSFSLLVAGAVTDALVPVPVADRKYLLTALERAVPVHGVMHVPVTLAEAAASLAQGGQMAKQVILFSDGQAAGWQLDDLTQWGYLEQAFERLPSRPQIFVRMLELPEGIRNLTLKGVNFSRPVIGTDRSVRVEVTVVNNGVEAVTPSHVVLKVEGEELVDRSIGQMVPGGEQVVSFMHRFKKSGAQVVEARIVVDDDMEVDNTMRRVVQVVKPLKVLVVDDGRGTSLLNRAGGYVALGLMPSASGVRAGGAGGEGGGGFLMQPELVTPGMMSQRGALGEYAVVVLADLGRLPGGEASRVVEFVEQGGSLLVLHGVRSEAEFYNSWLGGGGKRVVPLALGEAWVAGSSRSGGEVRIDTASFSHPALGLFKSSGDLADVALDSYRKMVMEEQGAVERVVGRLMSGDPVVAEQELGKGRVVQFCMALDRTTGSLVSSQSFLPLVHEVTAWLAQPVLTELNIVPARGAVVQLSRLAAGEGEEGGSVEGGVLESRVVGSDGVEVGARLRYGEDGVVLRTERALMQGLYQVEVPEVAVGWLGHLVGDEGSFPLCVMEDPEESRMERLTADEQRVAERVVGLSVANSMEELVQGLRGRSFGRELWRIPAVVLLGLLVLEVGLTRWIYLQREQTNELTN